VTLTVVPLQKIALLARTLAWKRALNIKNTILTTQIAIPVSSLQQMYERLTNVHHKVILLV